MSQLNIIDSIKTMSSKEIAKITGKRHDNVVRDVRILNKAYENIGLLKIEFSLEIKELHNGGSKELPFCNLTKMQTFDLLTGYSTELRIKVNRRWAELEQQEVEAVKPKPKSLPKKRDHNRLTKDRLVSLLQDVALIEDNELRIRLVNKLTK